MIVEINTKNSTNAYLLVGIIAFSTILSLSIKILNFDYLYSDYAVYLGQWIQKIQANGYFWALEKPFYNYTPLYMYVLTLLAKLDINYMYAIKIISICFEYVCAFYVGRLAFLLTNKEYAKWIPFAIVPLIPSIMMNSSLMSQCDAIYVSFLLGSVYYLLKNKQIAAIIFLGIAFSLKLQSAFILPFYFIYMLRGNIKWYLFPIVTAVYILTILPVWITGRPFLYLLGIYLGQGNDSNFMALSFPNIYLFLDHFRDAGKLYGMVLTTIIVLAFSFFIRNKKYNFDHKSWIILLFLSVIACPYFLPGMHERYLYFGDMVAVLYVFTNWKNIINWLVAFGIFFISYFSYADCLLKGLILFPNDYFPSVTLFEVMDIFPWRAVSLMYLIIILYVGYDLMKNVGAIGKGKINN